MKVFAIIVAVLALGLSALVGALGTNKSFDLGKEVSAVTAGMSDDQVAEAGIPSAGRLKMGGVLGIIGALAAVALLVASFVKKPLVAHLAIGTLAICAAAIVVYPGIDLGPTQGMAPRPQAMLAGGLALLGAAGAFLAARRRT